MTDRNKGDKQDQGAQGGAGKTDMDAMAQFFRRAMNFHGIPPNRLSKFSGSPLRPGDPTLMEWIMDFKEAVSPYDLSYKEKAKTLIEHLAGAAREEVMCLPEKDREIFQKIVDALQLCFGVEDSTQSLSTRFHNSHQHEGESLADFSRNLLRLYSRMETAAATQQDADALRHLRDRALRDQFARGAREAWVRRELRRIDLATTGSFEDMRRETLVLFSDPEPLVRKVRVREVEEQMETPVATVSSPTLVSTLAREVAEMKGEIEELKAVKYEIHELKGMVKQLIEKRNRPMAEIKCFNCNQFGHFQSVCPNRRGPSPGN